MRPVIKFEDVMKITSFLKENGYDRYGLTISSEVATRDALNKLNEDFFSRSDEKDRGSEVIYGDEISVNVDGVTFIYKLPDSDQDN